MNVVSFKQGFQHELQKHALFGMWEKPKPKKRTGVKGTAIALGGTAAAIPTGLALSRFAENALTQEDRNRIQPFIDQPKLNAQILQNEPPEEAAKKVLGTYLATGSEAAKAHPMGVSTGGFMKHIRSGPWMNWVKPLQVWKWDDGNPRDYQHYQQFSQGPIDAYKQFTQEHYDDVAGEVANRTQKMLPPTSWDKLTDYNSFPEKLQEIAATKLQPNEIAAHPEKIQAIKDKLLEFVNNKDYQYLPTEHQSNILTSFDNYLKNTDPELYKFKDAIDLHSGVAARSHADVYGAFAKTMKGALHTAPKIIGPTLAVGGALGSGYLLHKLLQQWKRRRAEQEQTQRQGIRR